MKRRKKDVRAFVHDLEEWLIRTLALFNIKGERREGRVGIWVARGSREDKIAAIGVRVRRWVTFHGVSLNVDPDLSHFAGIVPCGIREHGVTSLADLGTAGDDGRCGCGTENGVRESFRTGSLTRAGDIANGYTSRMQLGRDFMPRISICVLSGRRFYSLVGMGWGEHMAMSRRSFDAIPLHAHINLLGWVTLALYGTFYALTQETYSPRLAWINSCFRCRHAHR